MWTKDSKLCPLFWSQNECASWGSSVTCFRWAPGWVYWLTKDCKSNRSNENASSLSVVFQMSKIKLNMYHWFEEWLPNGECWTSKTEGRRNRKRGMSEEFLPAFPKERLRKDLLLQVWLWLLLPSSDMNEKND